MKLLRTSRKNVFLYVGMFMAVIGSVSCKQNNGVREIEAIGGRGLGGASVRNHAVAIATTVIHEEITVQEDELRIGEDEVSLLVQASEPSDQDEVELSIAVHTPTVVRQQPTTPSQREVSDEGNQPVSPTVVRPPVMLPLTQTKVLTAAAEQGADEPTAEEIDRPERQVAQSSILLHDTNPEYSPTAMRAMIALILLVAIGIGSFALLRSS
jgi:hypothetical protein